jgi:hypothetical protein
MNADELRRISERSTSGLVEALNRQTEERIALAQARAQEARQKLWDEEWSYARRAVERMEQTISDAAHKGERRASVYNTGVNEFLQLPGRSIGKLPEYAQYVNDRCPKGLKRKWELNMSSSYNPHFPALKCDTSPIGIYLVVSW